MVSQIKELLLELDRKEVKLWVQEGQLRSKAPAGAITPDIRTQIKFYKNDLIQLLQTNGNQQKKTARQAIPTIEKRDVYDLSNAQRRLWVPDQVTENMVSYNMPFTYEMEGNLNIKALEKAFEQIIHRHEILRTRLVTLADGTPRQVIDPPTPFQLPCRQWENKSETFIRKYIEEDHAHFRFDLAKDCLIRIELLDLGQNRYFLLLNLHHVIGDGWSYNVLFRELTTLYNNEVRGEDKPLQELKIQYKDYAAWQQQFLEDNHQGGKLRQFWHQQLADIQPLELATDYARPAVKTYNGDRQVYVFEAKILKKLEALGQASEVSLFMTLTALVKVLMYRYTRQEDIVLGMPIAGRNHPDLYDQLGLYVNMLCLRDQLSGTDSFEEVLQKVKQTALDAFEHEAYPFDVLVEEIGIQRDISRHPIFDVGIVLQNNENPDLDLESVKMELIPRVFKTSKFDLHFDFDTETDQLRLMLEYNTDIFQADRIQRIIGHLSVLMENVLTKHHQPIDSLNILPKEEKELLLNTFNPTPSGFPTDQTIISLFEKQVAATPDAIALIFENKKLTYQQLNEKASQLGYYLQTHYEIQLGDIVALQLERSEWMLIGILGVLKSGAAYLPVSSEFPESRINYMLQDSQAKVLLQDTVNFGKSDFELPVENIQEIDYASQSIHHSSFIIHHSSLAYIIYTSGSTGKPKGVMNTHQNVVQLMFPDDQLFDFGASDVWTLFHYYGFDFSVWEIWGALLFGGRLVIVPKAATLDPTLFAALLLEQGVTVLNQVPSTFEQTKPAILRAETASDQKVALRYIIFGGSALNTASLADWQTTHPEVSLINMYGITETTVHVTFKALSATDIAEGTGSVGKPLPTLSCYILDKKQQLLPLGIPGEICVSGAGLSRGYLNNKTLTNEKFVKNPFQKGERLYKSGDLGRWLSNGEIEHLGRIDHQLKIRGFRIEAGEIEQVLLQYPAISSAVVLGRKYDGEDVLQAFFALDLNESDNDQQDQAQEEMLGNWQEVFDTTYNVTEEKIEDITFDISGWTNSYTNQPILAEQMRQWIDSTAARILDLQPKKVLEIGVGSGMLLARIAPQVKQFVANDVSPYSIAKAAKLIATFPELAHAEVQQGGGHQLSTLGAKGMDMVIINSVAQYFPSQSYLTKVILESIEILEDGGHLFIGDIRSYPLLKAFHAETQLRQLPVSATPATFQKALNEGLRGEKELTLAPAYFYQLQQQVDVPLQVEITLKDGDYINELSQFRYDVTIKVGATEEALSVNWQDWKRDNWNTAKIQMWLAANDGQAIGIKNIPNARVYQSVRALDWLNGKLEAPQLSAFQALMAQEYEGLNPADFWKLVPSDKYHLKVNWSADTHLGAFDIAIIPIANGSENQHLVFPIERQAQGLFGKAAFSNFPLQNELQQSVVADLRTHLGQHLPDYMIPQYLIPLDEMPLNQSGKINRKALPSLDLLNLSSGSDYIAAQNQTEAVLVEIWEEVLHRTGIGIQDNFFELGGHSLRAIRVNALIYEQLSTKLKLSEFFAHPTIEELAKIIRTKDSVLFKKIECTAEKAVYPMSNAQRRLWIPDQIEENMVAYNMHYTFRLEGNLNMAALEKAFETLLHRHEILRTRLITAEDGTPLQVIDAAEPFQLFQKDFTNTSDEHIQEYIKKHSEYAFDLSKDCLLRPELLVLNKHFILLIGMHHILSDGWSMGILYRDLTVLYDALTQGKTPDLPHLRIQYKDYTAWQDELLSNAKHIGELRQYWQSKLGGIQALQLLTDYPRPSVRTYSGAAYDYLFSKTILNQLEALSHRSGTSLFMTLTALVKVLLYRYTKQKDIAVGTGIAGRNHPELYEQIGFYVNTLVLRDQLNGTDSFEQTLEKVKQTALAAFEHDTYPFDMAVEELEIPRDLSRHPLFDVLVIVQNFEKTDLLFGDILAERMENDNPTSKFDMSFFFNLHPDGLLLSVEYATDLFRTDTVVRLVEHLSVLLENVLAQPNQSINKLNILPAAEKQQLLKTLNHNETLPLDKNIITRFEEQVEKFPEKTAVVFESKELTYQELNEKANQLGHYLRAKYAIQADDVIALQVERSDWMIVAILGVLKSGAAFLPIAPDFPTSRVEYLLENGQAKALIVDEKNLENAKQLTYQLPIENIQAIDYASQPIHHSSFIIHHSSLAYIMYTSGSTGKPKGVMVEHRNVLRLVSGNSFVNFNENEVFLQAATYAFDASTLEIWGALLNGAKLVLVSSKNNLIEDIKTAVQEQGVSVMWLTAGLFHTMVEEGIEALQSLNYLLAGGDALSATHVKKALQVLPNVQLLNGYGPTENTTFSTTCNLSQYEEIDHRIPIGKPIAHTEVYIIDEQQALVPIGVAGELCVSGAGLSRGYLGEEAFTKEKFIPHPFIKGERLYRTGDLARWLPDGNVEFLGRIDTQFKIRGYRIEAGEIEQALLTHQAVQSAVVTSTKQQGENTLMSYFVADVAHLNFEKENEAQEETLKNWEELYNDLYDNKDTAVKDLAFDISGWMSSYTKAAIPELEMKQWAISTAQRIKDLQPKKVLEIGVGTGMFLARVGPFVEQYIATDLSSEAVVKIKKLIAAYPELAHATVQQGAAHQLPTIPKQSLNTIIVNSVVQYFPNQAYMNQVMLESMQLLEKGGHIFIGDVRSYALLKAFHADVKLFQLRDATSKEDFKNALYQAIRIEKELTIAPTYFYELQNLVDFPIQVEVHLKEGLYLNELSQYRYDVSIKVGETAEIYVINWNDWTTENWSLEKVKAQLEKEEASAFPTAIGIKNIPNARIRKGIAALDWINGKTDAIDIGTLKEQLKTTAQSINPGQFWELVKDTDYTLRVNYSADASAGTFDIAILPKTVVDKHVVFPIEQKITRGAGKKVSCNFPMQNALRKQLAGELKNYLAQDLPDYMIPQYFIPLDELPLNRNGKVDRQALPSLELFDLSTDSTYMAARNNTEATLVEIWENVLQRTGIGIQDNFFDLGGHSLRAIRVNSLIHQELSAKISLNEFFSNPTIETLAKVIRTKDSILFQAIEPIEEQATYPVSNAQRRLWIPDQIEKNMVAYNMPFTFRLEGHLNVTALEKAFETLIHRHEILRTRLITAEDGTPLQVIDKPQPFQLIYLDFSNKTETELQAFVDKEHVGYDFNLSKETLLRVQVVVREGYYMLLINMHHIIGDGTSMGVLYRELAILYDAYANEKTPELPPLRIQYKDYTAWQDQLLSEPQHIGNLRQYWHQQLADFQTLELPTDFARPSVQTYSGKMYDYIIPAAVVEQLEDSSRKSGASLFMTLATLVKILLYRYTNQEDITVGTGIAGRNHPELQDQIGFYINTLVLRDQIKGTDSFETALEKVKQTALDAFEHDTYPFDMMVEEMELKRDLSRHPLFDVLVVLQNYERESFKLGSMEAQPIHGDYKGSKFDLTFYFYPRKEGLLFTIEYRTDLFREDSIVRLTQHFAAMTANALAEPQQAIERLEILPTTEKQLLLQGFNQSETNFPSDKTIAQLFEQQAENHPDAVAVVFENKELTYQELNKKANQVAHYLRETYQIKSDDVVALQMERSEWMMIAIFGVLKAGAAYLPLAPDFPMTRVDFMLADTRSKVLIKDQSTMTQPRPNIAIRIEQIEKITHDNSHNPTPINSANNLAYLIYTSGSTGNPKGVMTTHRNIIRVVKKTNYIDILPEDTLLQLSNYAFDGSTFDIYGSLLNGAKLVILTKNDYANLDKLGRAIQQYDISIFFVTTAMFNLLVDTNIAFFEKVRKVLFGGEQVSMAHVEKCFETYGAGKFVHVYGPTETTVYATYYPIDEFNRQQITVPIGQPLANTEIYIIDEQQALVPINVTGELCISGAGLAKGYLNNPELTATKFIPHPFKTGEKLYRTGDLARWLADGNIEFAGRIDHQFKIRGYRMEAGEIEQALLEHPSVQSTVVTVVEHQNEKVLTGYFVADISNTDFGKETETQKETLQTWTELYDELYDGADKEIKDITFDISGWMSSYTKAAIPEAEMKIWAESTGKRINVLQPSKVLEIGVGTGMLLARVGPNTQKYIATDLSKQAVAKIQKLSESYPELAHTEVHLGYAHELPEIPNQSLDTIIINSVVQYFPSQAYLNGVMLKSLQLLEKGGHLFVGDVRSFSLLKAFHADIQLFQLLDATSKDNFKDAFYKSVRIEKELTIAPTYFYELQNLVDFPLQVNVQLKEGLFFNELSQYRYDVSIKVGVEATPYHVNWQDWKGQQWTMEKVQHWLENEPNKVLGLKNIPNARVSKAIAALEWVNGRIEAEDMGTFKEVFETQNVSINPGLFWKLLENQDCELKVNYSADAGSGTFDVAIIPTHLKAADQHLVFPIEQQVRMGIGKKVNCNFPMQNTLREKLATELKEFLGENLPDYMIPQYLIPMDEMPLSRTGKIDRKALPSLESFDFASSSTYIAPRNHTEATLVNIWEKVLQRKGIGVNDNFFDIGGHSLRATRVNSLIYQELGAKINLSEFFEYPTIEGLAQIIRSKDSILFEPIESVAERPDHAYPVSNAQRRLWVIDQLEEDMIAYNMPIAFKVEGMINRMVLEQSFQSLIERHEVLRTHFKVAADGLPYQVIAKTIDFKLPYTDWKNATQNEIDTYIADHANQLFSLADGPLVNAELMEVGEAQYYLLFNMHHIISDGWSLGVLWNELATLYHSNLKGETAALPPLSIQYKDYTAWQLSLLSDNERTEEMRNYWQQQLANVPALELPTDYPRPLVKSNEGDFINYIFNEKTAEGLNHLSRQAGASLFMTLTALMKVLLYRYTHQQDIIIGSPIAGRNHPDLHDQIGFYVNTLALRSHLNGSDSFLETLEQVKQTILTAFERDWYPFDQLVEELNLERDQSRSAVFDVMLVLQNNEYADLQLGDAQFETQFRTLKSSKFDLLFSFVEEENGELRLNAEYSTTLFKKDRIERMLQHLEQLMESVLIDAHQPIGQLNVLPVSEHNLLLQNFNNTQTDYPSDKTIIDLFEEKVAQFPNELAVIFEPEKTNGHPIQRVELTYQQVNEKANQLAHALREQGVKANQCVGLLLERGPEMLIGMLATFKAGAGYLPLDLDMPIKRLQFMLSDARPAVVVYREKTASIATQLQTDYDAPFIALDAAINTYSTTNPSRQNSLDDLIFVLYTSGSTGKPKGVAMPNRAMINLIDWHNKNTPCGVGSRTTQFGAFSFDASFHEIFVTLLSGGTLVMVDSPTRKDLYAFAQVIAQEKVNRIFIPFAAFQALAVIYENSKLDFQHLQVIQTAGEQLKVSPQIIQLFKDNPQCVLKNHYGPTEAHVVSEYILSGNPDQWEQLPPIGAPIANTQLYIFDKQMQLAPIGVTGELYIGGDCLADGYLNLPELTAERFIPHPHHPEQRLYKTGDVSRWRADGNIEFLGRKDHQLKIRGYRVETGEIEQILLQQEAIKAAVVIGRDLGHEKELVAYLIPNEQGMPTLEVLQNFISEQLPNYMLPAYFVEMEVFPKTTSGKVDKKALPVPDTLGQAATSQYVAPRDRTETTLVAIWEDVLHRSNVGIYDDFFDLGGHSLRAIRVLSLVQQHFAVKVPLSELFAQPTIAELAKKINKYSSVELLQDMLETSEAPSDEDFIEI